MFGRGGGGGARGGEKKAKAEIAYLHPDLCGEILYRLPSNDLLNCKLVSKEWLRLISSTGFIQKHLERSSSDCNDLRIVLPFNSDAYILNCASYTTKKIIFARCVVLGLCDGLVLYYDHRHRTIAAFNPCTGVMDEHIPKQCIQDNMERLVFSWFGHHPSSTTGEYALLLANKLQGETKDGIVFNVYSLSRNNINNITALSSSTLELDKNSRMLTRQNIGTLLHGRLHWPADNAGKITESGLANYLSRKPVILVYDFETKEVVRISPPELTCRQIVGVVNGCLCAATWKKQVWMMKEYGVEESWTKYADADVERERYKYGVFSEYKSKSLPLAFSPNGDHLIISRYRFRSLTKYSLRERQTERDQIKDYTSTLCTSTTNLELCIVCIDSLVYPTLLWEELEEEEVITPPLA